MGHDQFDVATKNFRNQESLFLFKIKMYAAYNSIKKI